MTRVHELPALLRRGITRNCHSFIANIACLVPGFGFLISCMCRPSLSAWRSHWEDEITFWDQWFEGYGLQWKEEYAQRLNPASPLQNYLSDLIDASQSAHVRVLDVGAGPLSSIGKRWEARSFSLTAVDPLAAHYDVLLRKYRLKPIVQTLPCEAETLDRHFPQSHFDLVHARNSLDHCRDPIKGIDQILRVVKNNCYVYLEHKRNEGQIENYEGLHHWNFDERQGDFVVTAPPHWTINVSAMFAHRADIKTVIRQDGWIVTTMRKRKHIRNINA